MAFNFKRVAQESTTLCRIMTGRKKLDTDEVIGNVLTIVGFDFAPKFDKTGHVIVDEETGQVEDFGVVVFKEYPDSYYCVGTVFTKVCHAWMEGFETIEQANDELESCGGVKVRFSQSKTKTGNNLTTVDILD